MSYSIPNFEKILPEVRRSTISHYALLTIPCPFVSHETFYRQSMAEHS